MVELKVATRTKPSRARMLPLEPRAARANRALLVDDGSAGFEDYARRLTDEGYDVTRASDPAWAVELAQHWEPNLIFVPGGPGDSRKSAFLGALKANDHTRHIPVVLLSSYFNARSAKDGLTAFTRP
jgi:twitching motility two-component system response regulator PilH